MTQRTPMTELEDLATELVLCDPEDRSSVAVVEKLLGALRSALPPEVAALGRETIDGCLVELSRLSDGTAPDPAAALEGVSAAVTELQRTLLGAGPASVPDVATDAVPDAVPDAGSTFVLPPWVDQEVLREFLANQVPVLEELEADALSLGAGDVERLSGLRRRLHTFKGEAGVLGLDAVERVCHRLEDRLEAWTGSTLDPEPLLRLRDWMAQALTFYGRGQLPPPLCEATEAWLEGSEAEGFLPPSEPTGELTPDLASPGLSPETLRIDLDRVDQLVETIGELVVVESMLSDDSEIRSIRSSRARGHLGHLAGITRELQELAMRMRMVPVRGLFRRMARVVHDLAHRSGKEIRLITSGESTELDRAMVEQLADPLIHLIRNAVDHGIGEESVRLAAGKPSAGSVWLSAYHEGGSFVIDVRDDGRGIDREKLRQAAIEGGEITAESNLSDSEVLELVFSPGLSTTSEVTEISGRGVGLDVVRQRLEQLRGRITIDTHPGVGTTFQLVLPLTLAIIDGLLVECGPERYIIPTLSVLESLQPQAQMLSTCAGGGELVHLRGETFGLHRLARLLDVSGARQAPLDGIVVMLESLGRRFGLLVDRVVAQQQVVIKRVSGDLGAVDLVSGAAVLADGHVGLILNVDALAERPRRNVIHA